MVLFTLPLENGIDLYDIMIYIKYHKNPHSACGNAILLTHYMPRQKNSMNNSKACECIQAKCKSPAKEEKVPSVI